MVGIRIICARQEQKKARFVCPQQRHSVYSATKILYKNLGLSLKERVILWSSNYVGLCLRKQSTSCWKFHFLGSGQQPNSHAHRPKSFFYTSSSTKFNQYQPTSSNKTMDTDLAIQYVFIMYLVQENKQNC
jgi:hypothetical protein